MNTIEKLAAPYTEGLKARSNIIIPECSPSEIIEKLSAKSDDGIVLRVGTISHDRLSTAADYKTLHDKIRSQVAKKSGSKTQSKVRYHAFRGDYNKSEKQYRTHYIYLDKGNASKLELPINKDLERSRQTLAAALLYLRLKCRLFRDIEDEYEIEQSIYNSRLFTGSILSRKPVSGKPGALSGFETDLKLNSRNEIVLDLKVREFLVKNASGAILDTEGATYHVHDAQLEIVKELDARKNKRKWLILDQEKYGTCRNYYENLLQEQILKTLEEFGIESRVKTFKPTHTINSFVNLPDAPSENTVIIDATRQHSDEPVADFDIDTIKTELNAKSVITPDQYQDGRHENTDDNYIVLSKINADKGTSITAIGNEDKPPKDFFEALRRREKNENRQFDFYTEMKIRNFSSETREVTQGIDLAIGDENEDSDASLIIPKKDTLKKILSEISLKRLVLRDRFIPAKNLIPGQFRAVKIRRVEAGKKKQFFASIADITATETGVAIESLEIIRSEDDFAAAFTTVRDTEKELWSGDFVLFCKQTGGYLRSYSGATTPQIIGSTEVSSVKAFQKETPPISRAQQASTNIAPFYISSTVGFEQGFIYIDGDENELNIFVRPKDNPKQTVGKRNLTRTVACWNNKNERANPWNSELVSAYLNSFTFSIHKVNKPSKSSLYEKIADIFLEN